MTSIAELIAELNIDTDEAIRRLRQDLSQAGEQGGIEAGDGMAAGLGGAVGAVAAAALAVVGVAAATAAKAIGNFIEREDVGAQIAASVGGSVEDVGKYADQAGEIWADNFGETTEEVGTVLAEVINSGLDDIDTTEATEKIITIGEITGESSEAIIRAVRSMVTSGLAETSAEALDMITKASQEGLNVTEDLMDTFNEYSIQFADLGLTGAETMGLLSQALEAGARNTDLVADAMKEFNLIVTEGGTAAADAAAELGLNMEDLQALMSQDMGAEALDAVLDALNAIEDPVKRDALAVGLFGTKAEDLGSALYAMDLDTAAAGFEDFSGATEDAMDTLASTPGAAIETFKRHIQDGLADAGAAMFEWGMDVATQIREGFDGSDLEQRMTDLSNALNGDGVRDFFSALSEGLKGRLVDSILWLADAFETVVGWAESFSGWIKDIWNSDDVQGYVDAIMSYLVPAFEVTKVMVQDYLMPALEAFGQWVVDNKDNLEPWVKAIGLAIAIVVGLFIAGTAVIMITVGAVVAVIAALAVGTLIVVGWMINAISPIVDSVIGFGQAVWDFYLTARQATIEAFNMIMQKGAEMRSKISDFVSGIIEDIKMLPVRIIAFILQLVSQLGSLFSTMKADTEAKVKAMITNVVTAFATLPAQVLAHVTDTMTRMLSAFSSGLENAKAMVQAGLQTVLQHFTSLGPRVVSAVTSMMESVKARFQAGIDAAVRAVASLPGKVAAALASLGAVFGSAIASAGQAGVAAMTQGVANIASTAGRIPSMIVAAVGSLSGILSEAGRQAGQGLINGLNSKLGGVRSAASALASAASSAINMALQIKSPSRVTTRAGEYTGDGFVNGILNRVSGAQKAAFALAGGFTDVFAPAVSAPFIGGGGTAGSGSTTGGTGSTTINNIDITVNGDDTADTTRDMLRQLTFAIG